MSKIILLISFTLLSCKSMPQKGTEPNTNDDEMLSTQEAELLNSLLENSRDTFDFHGKKIAFITGSSGSCVLSKIDYFTNIKPWMEAGDTPQIFMVELTGEEKNKSGGYDAFVLSWVKVFTDKRKKKVIEQLSKK
ncbi:MAG: hypothetical protein M0R02_07845 [Bacteroidales bacterium]|nr:hypothetical protein [Bacteroidales bacterium]